MDESVSILKLTSAMARHAAHAHAVTADNISRADVPGSRAREVDAFRDSLRAIDSGGQPRSEATGPLVNIEREMLSMAEARGRHDAALAVWKSSLNMMRLAVTAPQ